MKKIFFTSVFLVGLITVKGQISITADSMVICKSDAIQDKFIPISRKAESLSLEIDKDLLTLRVFGKDHEHALIENGYILDLLEVNDNQDKWLFQGMDRNCISYTITLDVVKKNIDFITIRKEPVDNRALTMTYYHIVDININKDAIVKHLLEKGSNK
jgi:hypothetical protein